MLSFVVIIHVLLVHQLGPVCPLETIEAALASTVELPCAVGEHIEPTNPAKVYAPRDKCLYVRAAFVIVGTLY